MADEFQLQFHLAQAPAQAMPTWRDNPPQPLQEFDLVDVAFDTLIFEQRHTDAVGMLMNVMTLGLGRRYLPTAEVRKLTVRFDAGQRGGSRVTMIGKADPKTRAALAALAADHGGSAGPSFGTPLQ